MSKIIHGVRPDPVDSRDYEFTAKIAPAKLPTRADLRQYAGNIEDQLDTGSCVANATVSALEILARKEGKVIDFSRLFVYYNIREPYPDLKEKDEGAYLRDGFKSVNKFGVPHEDVWKFITSNVNTKPNAEAYELAKLNVATEYRRIYKNDIYGIKSALAEGYPVNISMGLGEQFLYLDGPISRQNYRSINSWNNKLVGYHAMNIVGFDDSLASFIVENSWGSVWGDEGYCRIPYYVVMRDALDLWVCTGFDITVEVEPEPQPEPEVVPDDTVEPQPEPEVVEVKQFTDQEVKDILALLKVRVAYDQLIKEHDSLKSDFVALKAEHDSLKTAYEKFKSVFA